MAEVMDRAGGVRAANPLQDRTFVTDATMEDDVFRPVVDGTLIRLSFRAGHLGAHAGCNSLDFPLAVEPGRLRTGEPASTLMGCDEERTAQDAWLTGFLAADPTWSLSEGGLLLRSGHEWMELTEEVGEPRPLWGRSFRTRSVTGTPEPLVPGTSIVLTFTEAEELIVDAGCNAMSFPYTTGGDAALIVGNLRGSTRMGCSPELTTQDEWIARWLPEEPFDGLMVVGDTMTLTRREAELVLIEEPVGVEPPQLWGRTFEATVVGAIANTLVEGSTITFEFGDPGSLSVLAGCNTVSFGVRHEPEPEPGRLVVDDDVASTDMACTPEMQAQDEWLIALLTADPFAMLSPAALTLAGPGGTLTLFARP